ncbi:hypothetical protein [Moraxella catarrhalis]|uniref:hypothetical protein n=1 Tax=Moraxella catarrhalis TaxID=480 RepID=UPI0007F4C761|nr:hypothetical protein [Moraxella catarrhalis]OAV08730.1 hypothetical protein AO378_1521 [Moraxella catarrhalis]
MSVYSQYPLVLDAAFVPTRTGWYLWMSTIVLVLLICLAVGLLWWQWVSLGVCTGVLIWFLCLSSKIRHPSDEQPSD